mmetsp:Transcript_13459/g.26431  ORF Transcript_13459/g.26431 Transcript_13459/m.26431 type:complete len:226 (-) Transcript_13459:270-947(-)
MSAVGPSWQPHRACCSALCPCAPLPCEAMGSEACLASHLVPKVAAAGRLFDPHEIGGRRVLAQGLWIPGDLCVHRKLEVRCRQPQQASSAREPQAMFALTPTGSVFLHADPPMKWCPKMSWQSMADLPHPPGDHASIPVPACGDPKVPAIAPRRIHQWEHVKRACQSPQWYAGLLPKDSPSCLCLLKSPHRRLGRSQSPCGKSSVPAAHPAAARTLQSNQGAVPR